MGSFAIRTFCFAKWKSHVYCIGMTSTGIKFVRAGRFAKKNDNDLVWSFAYKHAHGHGWLLLHHCTWWPGAGGLWTLTTAIEQHASMVTGRRVFEQRCGRGRHGQRVVGKHAASLTSPVVALWKNPTSPPTRQELFGALFSLFVAVWAWRPALHAARRREK